MVNFLLTIPRELDELKKICITGAAPSGSRWTWHPTPLTWGSAPMPRMLLEIGSNPPNYRLSLVIISESGSQKSLVSNSLRMLNIRPTISQKLQIFKFGAKSVSEHCPSLGTEKSHNSKNFERHIAKIRNLIFIRFGTLRNFLDQRRAAPFIGYH